MTGRDQRDREHFRDLPSGDTIRIRFNLDRGRVTDFTAQLECWIEGGWRPVVRYDSAHGQPHRDTLDWDGRVVQKDWMSPTISLNRAISEAEEDLRMHAATYRMEYLGRKSR